MAPSKITASIPHVIAHLTSLEKRGTICGKESEADAKRQLVDEVTHFVRLSPNDNSVTFTAARISSRLLDRGYVKLTNDRDVGHGWEVTRRGHRLTKAIKIAAAN